MKGWMREMAIVFNQKVRVNWTNRNSTHFTKLGYPKLHQGEEFKVDIRDLTKGSHALIKLECDYCSEIFENKFSAIQKTKNHFCSKKCQNLFLVGKPSWNSRKIELECDYCKEPMIRSEWELERSNNLFCSRECADKFMIGKEKPRVERFKINCDNCNKEMEWTQNELDRGEHHFCCKKCSDEYSKGKSNLKNRNGENVTCHNCDESFYLAKNRIESQERYFCCNECRIEWMKTEEFSKVISEARGDSSIKTNCKYCGEEMFRKPSEFLGHGQHYCSRSCVAKNRLSKYNPNPKKEKIRVNCYNCGKEKLVHESIYKKNKYFFCSHDCYQQRRIEISDFKQTNTGIHIKIQELLNGLNIEYYNEYGVSYYSLDILLSKFRLGIEVMGDYWHGSPIKYDNISVMNDVQLKNIKTDKRKKSLINKKFNIPIFYLWEDDINNNIELCEKLIVLFISSFGKLKDYNSFNYKIENGILNINDEIIKPFFLREKQDLVKIPH